MAENKRSFILYADLIHTFEKLPDEIAGKLMKIILNYVNDKNPVVEDLLLQVAFEPIKRDIDRQFYNLGSKHWNWKGGISPENKLIRNGTAIRLWRKEVFERDDYTCQRCNQKGGTLHAHHIKEFSKYPELRFEITNGMTLCRGCHKKIHCKK